MSDSKHTPGPWEVQDPMGADWGLWIVQSGLEPAQWACIAAVHYDDDGTSRDVGNRSIYRREQSANACLIAAAPELLEALQNLLAANDGVQNVLCDGPDVPGFDPKELPVAQQRVTNAENVARAVIAKAVSK